MRASFRVEIAGRAENDLLGTHDFIAQDKKKAARKWLRGALAACRSLRTMPYRCERIPEGEALGVEDRHLLFGNYRIIFRIQKSRVRVLRVIHGARQLTREMLQDEPS